MPLSEEELRLLEQMERALVEEDPKLASTLRGTSLRRAARRRAIVAGFCFVLGVAVLLTGAITQLPLVGVAGFVVMLISATVALTALRSHHAPEPAPPPHSSGFSVVDAGRSPRRRTGRTSRSARASSSTFMERMEERWRRRRDERGGW